MKAINVGGTNWVCPPDVGSYKALTEELKSCKEGILMQMIYQLDDPYDIDGWKKAFDAFDNRFDELIAQVTEHIHQEVMIIQDKNFYAWVEAHVEFVRNVLKT